MADSNTHIKKRRKIGKLVIYVEPDHDLNDLQPGDKDDIEDIKRDLKEIIDYNGNTTEYHPKGKIEITPNYLKPIPNEIIEMIINHLLDYHQSQQNQRVEQKDFYELTLVSKQFYDLTNRFLWHTPYIYNADILQRFQSCLNIARLVQPFTNVTSGLQDIQTKMTRHHVRKLVLDGDHWNDVEFSLLMPHLSLLEQLIIINVGDRISALPLIHVPRYFPHLTLLFLRINHLTQNCVDAIAQHCRQIRDLELPFNFLPSGTFKALANNDSLATTLKSLRFHHMKSNSISIGIDIISVDMIKDMTRLHNVTHLTFHGFDCPSPPNGLFTATTSEGTPAWPSLSYLFIDNANQLDELSFISFIKSHPYLQSIYLIRSHISDSSLDIMATHLPSLVYLSVCQNKNITSHAVYRLVQRCQYLNSTNFNGCTTLFKSMPELSRNKAYFTPAELANIRRRAQ